VSAWPGAAAGDVVVTGWPQHHPSGFCPRADAELLKELARRHAEKIFREGMTMSEMELAVEAMVGTHREPSIRLMLMKPEKPTAKPCPSCGKRTAVKARDRERTVRSLSGPVTFKRNYHYCEGCKVGFYPVDRMLDLPEEGELTAEMEKRVLDFALDHRRPLEPRCAEPILRLHSLKASHDLDAYWLHHERLERAGNHQPHPTDFPISFLSPEVHRHWDQRRAEPVPDALRRAAPAERVPHSSCACSRSGRRA
jgi:hypothetical protein